MTYISKCKHIYGLPLCSKVKKKISLLVFFFFSWFFSLFFSLSTFLRCTVQSELILLCFYWKFDLIICLHFNIQLFVYQTTMYLNHESERPSRFELNLVRWLIKKDKFPIFSGFFSLEYHPHPFLPIESLDLEFFFQAIRKAHVMLIHSGWSQLLFQILLESIFLIKKALIENGWWKLQLSFSLLTRLSSFECSRRPLNQKLDESMKL